MLFQQNEINKVFLFLSESSKRSERCINSEVAASSRRWQLEILQRTSSSSDNTKIHKLIQQSISMRMHNDAAIMSTPGTAIQLLIASCTVQWGHASQIGGIYSALTRALVSSSQCKFNTNSYACTYIELYNQGQCTQSPISFYIVCYFTNSGTSTTCGKTQ